MQGEKHKNIHFQTVGLVINEHRFFQLHINQENRYYNEIRRNQERQPPKIHLICINNLKLAIFIENRVPWPSAPPPPEKNHQ